MRLITSLFAMSDDVWDRHANPWSVWTRIATTPFLFAALWSHLWLGWWALAPTGLLMVWIWLNPRLFAKPASTDNWASKGVMGERVWLARKEIPIPAHHARAATVTSTIAGAFLLAGVHGLVAADFWAAFLGLHGAALAKIWFVDRMAWLYDDMKDSNPRYRAWLR